MMKSKFEVRDISQNKVRSNLELKCCLNINRLPVFLENEEKTFFNWNSNNSHCIIRKAVITGKWKEGLNR